MNIYLTEERQNKLNEIAEAWRMPPQEWINLLIDEAHQENGKWPLKMFGKFHDWAEKIEKEQE